MITIWKTPIVATVEQVLKDLKLQLYGAGLLKEIKNTGSDLMCTCPFHANGKEHNPSCGVLLQQKVEKMAEEYGYVTTIQGRKRRLPEMQLPDHDDYRYQEAHRQSLNAVIQGSSADIMKLAMIAIYNDPQYKALDCHMVITVHDELIMEVPEDHIKEGADLLVNTMKRVGHSLIDLPMSVDAEVNDYWYGENLADDYLEEE